MTEKEWLERKGILWLGFSMGCFSGGASIGLGSPIWIVMIVVVASLILSFVFFWKAM
jgi:hypothetical protein